MDKNSAYIDNAFSIFKSIRFAHFLLFLVSTFLFILIFSRNENYLGLLSELQNLKLELKQVSSISPAGYSYFNSPEKAIEHIYLADRLAKQLNSTFHGKVNIERRLGETPEIKYEEIGKRLTKFFPTKDDELLLSATIGEYERLLCKSDALERRMVKLNAISPNKQQLDAIGQVMEACDTFYPLSKYDISITKWPNIDQNYGTIKLTLVCDDGNISRLPITTNPITIDFTAKSK
ncbi:MAG: hypothetical protein ABW082_14280 [Sedimenticola sp.]